MTLLMTLLVCNHFLCGLNFRAQKRNYKILSGALGYEALVDYSEILEAHPDSELLKPFGLTFAALEAFAFSYFLLFRSVNVAGCSTDRKKRYVCS